MAKILVIDDEALLRDEVADWLEFEGNDVLTAENGQVGLELATQVVPGLIICDIAMPELDGYGVLLEVRSNPKLNAIPFIFLTASSTYEAMRYGMNLGADDYLTKPFKRTDLLNAVQTRLQKFSEQQDVAQEQLSAVRLAFEDEKHKRLLQSRLVAMFSHDFRNPLASILSSAELIKKYEDRLSAERKKDHLDRISGSVRLLLQMLDDMLMIAEMEHGQLKYHPQPVDIDRFVSETVEEFRLIYGDSHVFVLETTFSDVIQSDPKLLRQILNNLLSNAVKYSSSGSTVRVYLQATPRGLELCVSDEGLGIAEEDQKHLFEAFYRASNVTEQRGTGLGLPIVKEAIGLCGGDIRVISKVNEGSTFVIELPLDHESGRKSQIGLTDA
jgi:signal transduction histidine kinase